MRRTFFWDELHQNVPKAAVLSLRGKGKFSENFKPKSLFAKWPIDLSRVCLCSEDTSCLDSSYEQVLKKCSAIDLSVSKEEASFLEKETMGQSNSLFWHRFRTGRITASNFYCVYHTSISQPSLTVLKTICASYVNKMPFYSAATAWKTKHEITAKMEYSALVKSKHDNYKLVTSGLIINERYPQFRASPDGMVFCACCGDGCLEIKCPYSMKDKPILDVPWLKLINKQLTIDCNHEYYYQMQMQMFLSDRQYCDFYVWCPHDYNYERVHRDNELWQTMSYRDNELWQTMSYRDNELWQTMSSKALEFHSKCVMPELLCNYFSQRQVLSPNAVVVEENSTISIQSDRKYCICGGDDDGRKMIMCESENCTKVWFHTSCIKLKHVPKGKWYCGECK